jgi:long-chain acyl-CoA synthetase
MFEGYWGDSPSPANRWYDTDDLGFFDKNGYLHLVGRRSESVRSGGVSFSLKAIRHNLRSVRGVVDADVDVVYDDRLGERVRASVIVTDGSDLDATEVRRRLRSVVTDPRMIPSEILIRTATANSGD